MTIDALTKKETLTKQVTGKVNALTDRVKKRKEECNQAPGYSLREGALDHRILEGDGV